MADFDASTPSIARVYDYLLGGKDNFAAGMPTAPNTHETAQGIIPGARVAYVDHDPVVLAHLRALAAHGNPISRHAGIDLSAPACLLMGFLLHFFAPEVPEFASFFGSLDLVPPGVVDSREWQPDLAKPVHLPPRDGQAIVGVARVG